MKNNKIILLLLLFTSVFVGCDKLKVERINKITTNELQINSTTAKVTSNILDLGKVDITEYGHTVYNSYEPPLFFIHQVSVVKGLFTDTLRNLDPNTAYHTRSYYKVGEEITYGESKYFMLSSADVHFQNSAPQYMTKYSAKIQANINNMGSLKAPEYGICWHTSVNPIYENGSASFQNINCNKSFDYTITGLSVKTHYHSRIFVKFVDQSIVYGNDISIYIPDISVSTISAQLTGSSTATIRGKIDSLGVPAITDHGFCLSTLNSSPTINDTKYSLGAINQAGEFTQTLTAITQSLRYYFRAYAMEGNNVKYGSVMSFQINK